MKSALHGVVGQTIIIIFFTLLHSQKTYSQHLSLGSESVKLEVGLNFGPTFFLGDLGGNMGKGTHFLKDLNIELTKMMKGAFVAFYPTDWLGLRAAAQYTYVTGRDNIINTEGEDELWRKQRNLDFKSDLWEVYGAFEIYPTMLFKTNEDYDPRVRPYGFIGVGVFHFDPKGSISDANGKQTWHKLHPLKTEGQGLPEYPDKKPYSLTQINIPMGCGLRYSLSEKVNLSPELLYRKTFTDYIDDVSTTYIDPKDFDRHLPPKDALIARKIHDKTIGIITPGVNRYEPGTQRGNSKNMDAYFSFVLKLGVRLGSGSGSRGGLGLGYGSNSNRKAIRQMKCPHYF